MFLGHTEISADYMARCQRISDRDLERIGGTLYAAMTRNTCSSTGHNCPGCNRPTRPDDEPLPANRPKPRPPGKEPALGMAHGRA